MTDSSIPDIPAFADALSPLERARLGLQDELSVFEIGLLTYPEEAAYPERERLTGFLIQAIKAGRLAAYGDPDGWDVQSCVEPPGAYENNPWARCNLHDGTRITMEIRPGYYSRYADMRWHGDNCLIRRADYLAFLATKEAQGIPKPDPWKAPQGEPALSAPTLPQGEPAPLPQSEREQGAAAKHAALESLLAEIDKRAAEQGAGFNRHSLPGTKKEFAQLLKSYCPVFRHIETATIADYLKNRCQFQPGAKPEHKKGTAVWALFPECDLK